MKHVSSSFDLLKRKLVENNEMTRLILIGIANKLWVIKCWAKRSEEKRK